ncbi:hypothetical protein HMI54_015462 [Coelomomyces lativittatus]|nr:hypothetical protein HMI54_015462 [Coelomomyces lativittatus]
MFILVTNSPSKCKHQDESIEENGTMENEDEQGKEETGLELQIKNLNFEEIALQVKSELLSHLNACYEHVEEDAQGMVIVKLDDEECKIDVFDLHITCDNPGFKRRVQNLIENVGQAVSESWIQKWFSAHSSS